MNTFRTALITLVSLTVIAVFILEVPNVTRMKRATQSSSDPSSAPPPEMKRHARKPLSGVFRELKSDQPLSEPRKDQPLLSLKELARRKARQVPSCPSPTVIVGLVDTYALPLFHTWYRSAQLAGVNNLLPVAINVETHRALQKAGIEAYLDRRLAKLSKRDSIPGSFGYHQKGRRKFSITLEVLELGYAVLMSDVDLYFIRDPFPFLDCFDCDFEVSQDDPKVPATISVGFVYFRPTKKTLAFLRGLMKILMREKKLWDQAKFQEMMWKGVAGIKHKVLDPYVFVTGGILDNGQMEGRLSFRETLYGDMMTLPDIVRPSAVVFHASWLNCFESKICWLRELGMWLSDEPNMYYSDPQRKYISYEIHPPKCKDEEEDILHSAQLVARLLNRTLIVPLFTCTTGSIARGKLVIPNIKPHGCTICDKLYRKWKEFLKYTGGNFREHSFLNNPLVPQTVKNSVSPLISLKSNATWPSHDKQSEQRDKQILEILEAYKGYAVIHLDARTCSLISGL